MKYCKNVSLRERKIANGKLTLYLDYYPGIRDKVTMKIIRREYLGIYIYANPKNKMEKDFNKKMREKAETIRCQRYESVVSERYDLFDQTTSKRDFLAYYKRVLVNKNVKWQFVYQHFVKFVNGHCTCGEVDLDLCRRFREYLINAKSMRTGKVINQNSAAGYWSTFRGFLKIAFADRMIQTNPNDFLERIEPVPTQKDSLTLPELRKLSHTPCEEEIIRRAALFSCMTGLRRSDIKNLDWDNVSEYADGGLYLDFISKKTKKRNYVPISKETFNLIAPRGKGLVFPGLTNEMLNHPLKKWIKSAGITKNITFHSFRHTYASLQIELGTDLYTVQHLLAHSDAGTTQRYARHADPKSREAADKISLNILQNDGKVNNSEGTKDEKVINHDNNKS